MKKKIALLLAVVVCLSGCKSEKENTSKISSDNMSSTPSFQDVISDTISGSESNLSETTSSETISNSEAASNTESESPPVEKAETDLFDKVYLPYAKREYSPQVNDVKAFVADCGFESSVSTDNGFTEIKVLKNEDYVYFAFTPRSVDDNNTFTIISYYLNSTKSEVSLNNFSSNGSYEYDMLQTHIIGESNNDVTSVAEQRKFLFGETVQSPTETNSDVESKIPNKPTFTLNTGKILDVTVTDDNILVIKAKIKSLLTNKQTINQNYHNVEDIIRNQGGNKYKEIQYWAVADMMDGSEGKVISFTVPENIIKSTSNGNTVAIQYPDLVTDLWILPSLMG